MLRFFFFPTCLALPHADPHHFLFAKLSLTLAKIVSICAKKYLLVLIGFFFSILKILIQIAAETAINVFFKRRSRRGWSWRRRRRRGWN